MCASDFEIILYDHADRMRDYIKAPFNLELEDNMINNRRSAKRIVFIAVAAALLLGTSAFAAGVGSGWFSFSSSVYEELPSKDQYVADVGHEPVLVEQFNNGFVYSSGQAMDNQVISSDMETETRFKSSLFEYTRDGEIVYFSQDKTDALPGKFGQLHESYEGIDFYYYSYINTVVPEDYRLTAADIEARDRGEVVFTFGSYNIFTMEVKSLSWYKDGISFMLMQTGGSLTADDLMEMAKETFEK